MNKKPNNNNNQENRNQGNQENPAKIKVQTTAYKNTEIGVIPEDWEVKSLDDTSKIIMGQSPNSSNYNNRGIGMPLIQGNADIKNRKTIIRNYTSQITKTCKKNDIIMSVRAPVGEIAKTSFDACIGRGVCAIKTSNNFLYHYLIFFEPKWSEFSTGSTFDSVNSETIKQIKIPLPPLPEQKAIATVLSDTDSLIQALEKKIAKKQLIKKGAMQKLLNPINNGQLTMDNYQLSTANYPLKKGWITKTLGEVGKTYGGLSGKSKVDFSDGNSKYIPFMNIMSNPKIDIEYLDSVYIKPNEIQNKAQKGDLFFNGSSETPEEVGMCSVLLEDVSNLYLNSFCFGFRLFNMNEISGLYLSYFFRSPIGRDLIFSLAQGATRYNLSKSNFLKMEIKLPEYEEQTRIAQILSDMDAEIETLEKKLAKYKQIKQGLMQVLLTGKIRLV